MGSLELEALSKLKRDLRDAAATLSQSEARFLVDAYYSLQDYRKAAHSQVRALSASGEPHSVIGWLGDNTERLENNLKRALAVYSQASRVGRWAESIVGIGPVISAGLLAHIEIEKAPTVGHIWRFAGLDPTVKWEKSNKRPWNARLKVLAWKIGESFVKLSGNSADVYGKIWLARKELEQEKNLESAFREQAETSLKNKTFRRDTTAFEYYEKGMLPPARIHLRAERYATKLFLSHWHAVAFEVKYGKKPPKPYVIDHLKHAEFFAPPNWPCD